MRTTPYPRLLPGVLLALLICIPGARVRAAEGAPLLLNGGFEATQPAYVSPDGTFSNWTFADPPKLPKQWTVNTSYPGRLAINSVDAHSGRGAIRIEAKAQRGAHLYQMVNGFVAGDWYRIEAWFRGGRMMVCVYEYYEDGRIQCRMLTQGTAAKTEGWQRLQTFYQPSGRGYQRSALALVTPAGRTVDIDDVSLTRLPVPPIDPNAPPIVFENDVLRLGIGRDARLAQFQCKATGREYSATDISRTVLTAARDGMELATLSATPEAGGLLRFQFTDTETSVRVRITPRKHHFLLEIVDVSPESIDRVDLDFPVTRLETISWALNGTHNDEFAACLFGTTINVCNRPADRGPNARSLQASCYRDHGIVGAGFALIGAPRDQFKAAIMEAERENGLPCPVMDGEWVRDSDAVRRSYLFATEVKEQDIDTLIDYAKLGGFGTILILKDSWLTNHGHFDVNTGNFPGGRDSLRRAVARIHAAGLHAGVHVFGPSISPNDPYVTPKPDDRLASVPCPPLAEAVDAAAKTLTLTEQPQCLLTKAQQTRGFPGHHFQVGDEIIRYAGVEAGPPFRFVRCERGALGTVASAHPAGSEVKGLPTLVDFFLVDPGSTLVDELTQNFADVFNACDFDMVYFDASDGRLPGHIDRWYYQNKLHLGFYSKFKRDILYQVSNGTGSNILWHIVPRSASADGHGDLKGWLDQRWPTILSMADNFTRADVGWYYWFKECRPDQIEYVCAKALGVDSSISLETSREAMERLTQTRQMFEMIARYEQCRRTRALPESVRAKLREPKKDFRLFRDSNGGWRLNRAVYEEPRLVDQLDEEQNVWSITNTEPGPVQLGIEILRGTQQVATAAYKDNRALTIETFENAEVYCPSDNNGYEKYVLGGGRTMTPTGPVRQDVTQSFEIVTRGAKAGDHCLAYAATNRGAAGGWGGIGRRFAPALDVDAFAGAGAWIHGDAKDEKICIQFRDAAGHHVDWLQPISFRGWRFLTFPLPKDKGFDWTKVEFLLFYFNGIRAKTSVRVMFDDLRMLRELQPHAAPGRPIAQDSRGAFGRAVVHVNERRVEFPVSPKDGQALTVGGPDGVRLWPGGMEESRRLDVEPTSFTLRPGPNTIRFETTEPNRFPGDVTVLLYRMWPLEE
ncbi:MAG: hypothetical protein HN742_29590 [Lentisphaerae bacterium]|jgi:hypothetical protein|nr:hypothetical protein [Lentisphaerota bacterium]MBT5607640.1 hypothetical protein [Lentisphaerota bacterium]MBT7053873.1 hypothetical protein [Lentisphaerota bacterium]MBT7846062.1 hypothetical protein [Lentisphaerota bacterium]